MTTVKEKARLHRPSLLFERQPASLKTCERSERLAFLDTSAAGASIGRMPTISAFYGIIVRMYHRDHAPAHFHAFYQGREARIDIENLELLAGRLPRRALGLVLDWVELHQNELRENWTLAQQRRPMNTIRPLE